MRAAAAVVDPADFVASFAGSALARWRDLSPWELTSRAATIVAELTQDLDPHDYAIADGIALHRSAVVEAGAVLKGPLVLGAGCFVASGAYLRGGCWLAEGCTVGPGAELKSSFVFAGTKLAHFNFVGDSLLGAGVNLEAGSIVCNFRNERADPEIRVRVAGALHRTGAPRFGALVGDGARIGANAVLAPGVLLPAQSIVRRGAVCDQDDPAGTR